MKQLILPVVLLAIVGYFAFPYYQEYRLYQQAWTTPSEAHLDDYFDDFPEGKYSDRLKVRFDEQQLKKLLSHCTSNEQSGKFGGDESCCAYLKWHVKKGRRMYERDKFTAALDSCMYYNTIEQSAFERVSAYQQSIGMNGRFSPQINDLVQTLSMGERFDALRPPPEEESQHKVLAQYLGTTSFRDTVPVFFDGQFELPKSYQDYPAEVRELLETAILQNSEYYNDGRQPQKADFARVANPIWAFHLGNRDKRKIMERLQDHLNKYVERGYLRLAEPSGPPIERPRIEFHHKIQHQTDTVAGIVVPVLSVRSETSYESGKPIQNAFSGYSLTSELLITLKYYPADPTLPPFIYYGKGTPDDEIYSVKSGSSGLAEKSNESGLQRAIDDLLGKIYLQIPVDF